MIIIMKDFKYTYQNNHHVVRKIFGAGFWGNVTLSTVLLIKNTLNT